MIAIEDMDKLPENCHRCPLSYWASTMPGREPNECWCPWHNCTTDGINGGDKQRMRGCPLKEVECE